MRVFTYSDKIEYEVGGECEKVQYKKLFNKNMNIKIHVHN